MDLFSPLRLGVKVTTGAARVATGAPRMIFTLLGNRGEETADPAGVPSREGVGTVVREPSGPARGGTGRRGVGGTGSRATPGRASVSPDGTVETTKGPPEPTSAAGASGGIAGTADAPGDAAAVSAPDPTAAEATAEQRTAPQGERRPSDVRAVPQPREKTPAEPDALVESEGSAAPHATIRIDAPWDGYDTMKAGDIVERLRTADATVKAVVRLYEQNGRKRKSILSATD
jgi:hypothetical protein